jgi:hypothetical protein
MKMKYRKVGIHWKGPYKIYWRESSYALEGTDEKTLKEFKDGSGIYLLTGKVKHKIKDQIQYCGIAEHSYYDEFVRHPQIPQINRDLRVWLGRIDFPKPFTRDHLEEAEAITIRFWRPVLNKNKKSYPSERVIIISHWFKPDGSPRLRQPEIIRDLDDVLCWDGTYWRTGNLSVWEDD